MIKRIYGLSLINNEMTSWNSNTRGEIRQLENGTIWVSDVSRKYAVRNAIDKYLNNQNVFLKRTFDNQMQNYKTVKTIYNDWEQNNFQSIKNKKTKDIKKDELKELVKTFFNSFLDIRLFGLVANTVNADKFNFNFIGPVQFMDAFNIIDNSNIETKDIIGIANDVNKSNVSTFGKKTIIDRAVFNYPFIIDFNNYKENYQYFSSDSDEIIYDSFMNDINILKELLKIDVTNINSCTKTGCSNLFNIYFECQNEKMLDLNYLKTLININWNETEKKYDLTISKLKSYISENFQNEIEIKYDICSKIINLVD